METYWLQSAANNGMKAESNASDENAVIESFFSH